MTERFQMKRTDSSCEGMRDVRDGNKQEQMEGRRWVICILERKIIIWRQKNIFPKESKVRDGNTTCKNQSGYRRYLYHQGNVQTTGGILRAAAGPWLIPAGK